MNIEEQRAHYAAVKNRIALKPAMPQKVQAPLEIIERDPVERERRKVILLAYGMPLLASDIKASILSMLLAYNVSWAAIISKSRIHRICMARRAITWILHLRGWSYPKIARLMGRDHSTCVYAIHRSNSWQYPEDQKIRRRQPS